MKSNNIDQQRRNILKQSIFGATAVAATSIFSSNVFATDELPELTEDDPMAVSLSYKKDTATVDGAVQTKHTAEQSCKNCALYTGKTDEAGTCTIFAGKQVSAKGWCTAWAQKA